MPALIPEVENLAEHVQEKTAMLNRLNSFKDDVMVDKGFKIDNKCSG